MRNPTLDTGTSYHSPQTKRVSRHGSLYLPGWYVLLLVLGLAIGFCGCDSARHSHFVVRDISPENKTLSPPRRSDISGARFVDIAQKAGLHYQWSASDRRPLNILQTIGYGCAFLDYNNDGNLDILLVGPKLALYRGDGQAHFTDVTNEVGLGRFSGDFRGCAVGDYDNDGWDDIYISGYRGGILLHNRGGKRFEDVTRQAGIAPQPWGSSCAFGDVNGDGRLDLFIGNYVKFGPQSITLCLFNGYKTACGPQDYDPEKGVLYINKGNGKFQDATRTWGLDKTAGKALGAAFADYNGKGKQSLAIANDEVAGDLLRNQGTRFENVGATAGTAYGANGKPVAGMGIDWGDYNNDGRLDLAQATFAREPKTIYKNEGDDFFTEEAARLGIANPSYPYVAFGMKWLDYDNDGWLDLMITNGHTSDNIAKYDAGRTYREPTLLFHNQLGRRFTDVSAVSGTALQMPIVGRGLATGDFDNDGRIDALIVDGEGAPLLLHNETPSVGHWLSLKLQGAKSNRDGIGTILTIVAGRLKLTRHCHTDGSFQSASDRRVHVGLAKAEYADVIARWPSGHVDRFPRLKADREILLQEGMGSVH